MRIEDELRKRAGIELDDLAKHEAFQHDVALAKGTDAVTRLQDAAQILMRIAQKRAVSAEPDHLPRYDTCWNFLIRAIHQSLGVLALMRDEDLPDVAMLNRGILERSLLLEWLRETDGFELFRRFTVVKEFEHQATWIRHHPGQGKGRISPADRKTALQYRRELKDLDWKRPSLEQIAKKMGVQRMYDGIYRYSSGHVHPLYGEGEMIFAATIGKPPAGYAEVKATVFGQTAASLALLCVVVAHTLGAPTEAGKDLLWCIQQEAAGRPVKDFDNLLMKAKGMPPDEILQPRYLT